MFNFKNRFDYFCNQNAAVAEYYTVNAIWYPIYPTALRQWTNDMLNRIMQRYHETDMGKKLAMFVTKFRDNLRYISKIEFTNKMDAVVNDFIEHFTPLPANAIAVLCISENIGKSNLWFSILYWSKIASIITHVIHVKNMAEFVRENSDYPIYIIYLDDAAYSGTQIIELFKPLINKLTRDRANIQITTCFLIPYMSEFSIFNIRREFVNFSHWSSSKIENFSLLYRPEEYKFRQLNVDVDFWDIYFYNHLGLNSGEIPNLHTIYFNHKLADTLSVYTQLIAFSPMIPRHDEPLTIDNIKIGHGFISNCGRSNHLKTPREVLLVDFNGTADKDKCPDPTYKDLNYEYFRTFFTTDENYDADLLEYLERLGNLICYGCGKECQIKCC